MTYPEDFTLPAELLEQVQAQGLDVLAELIRVLLNTAMQAERVEHLSAAAYQHNPERQGHAHGFKPKTMRTRGVISSLRFHKFEKVDSIRRRWKRDSAANAP